MPKKSKPESQPVAVSDCYTYTEAMDVTSIPKSTLHRAVGRGDIDSAETAGGTKLVIKASLEAYAADRPKRGRKSKSNSVDSIE